VLAAVSLSGCDARGEVREWRADDHDKSEEPQGRQVPGATAKPGDPGADATLVELAWGQKCMSCHGPLGRGDGPNGPMVGAPDLTKDELLGRLGDEDIENAIKNGKGKMPAVTLPDGVVKGLVRRVRAKGRLR
jgi:cytochrome c oxidase cbb3-type subunit 3